jgi:hypothetical protein
MMGVKPMSFPPSESVPLDARYQDNDFKARKEGYADHP